MRHNQVPYDRLERLGMRRDRLGIDGGHDDASVGDLGGKSPVAADDSLNLLASLAREAPLPRKLRIGPPSAVPPAQHKNLQPPIRIRPTPLQNFTTLSG